MFLIIIRIFYEKVDVLIKEFSNTTNDKKVCVLSFVITSKMYICMKNTSCTRQTIKMFTNYRLHDMFVYSINDTEIYVLSFIRFFCKNI